MDAPGTERQHAALEEPVPGIALPEKAECKRAVSDADLAAFERAVRAAGVCASPMHTAPSQGPDPARRTARWSLGGCADFGGPCTIQRTADEWTHDPKLRPLVAALEALARATCR